jgi:hypothetical protein
MKRSSASRDRDLLSLWHERLPEQRRKIDVMSFYSYIQTNHADLFIGITGDPYQYLNCLLSTHFSDKP